MEEFNVTIIQTDLVWENVRENLDRLDLKLNTMIPKTDLIVLPEMFTTGFAVDRSSIAETESGEGLQWMKTAAKKVDAAIVGSIAVKLKDKLVNRLYWVNPDGTYFHYDKRHLFRMANEHQYFEPGRSKLLVEYKGWKFCPLICYDLRFPIWSRNTWDITNENYIADYDALIYVANWPEIRSYPWKQLLIARAIENQAYVIGVNRVGKDGNGINHSGDSAVITPRGELLSAVTANQEEILTVTLKKKDLIEYRKVFPVGRDADQFELKIPMKTQY